MPTPKARDLDIGDAFSLARFQLAEDRQRTRRFPALFALKRARMLQSPHALFRGSAPLFYAILRSATDLGRLPRESGYVVGDMHLENVGAYRTDGEGAPVVFDLNDFDEAAHGLRGLDVLRLATSVLLTGRSFGTSAAGALELCERGLEAYARARAGRRAPKADDPPRALAELVSRANARSQRELLDRRAPLVSGKRHLVRGERYLELPAEVSARAPQLLDAWLTALGPRAPKHASSYRVIDVAQRVAGTGSLGALRLALLITNAEGDERIVELKEALPSCVHPWPLESEAGSRAQALDASLEPAERVVVAARALVAQPVRRLAALPALRLQGRPSSLVGRALTPQDDKLELSRLDDWSEKEALVRLVFRLLALAHRRSSDTKLKATWSDRELAALVDRSVWMAGLFEGVALAYARIDPG